jgi:hypothetical protein
VFDAIPVDHVAIAELTHSIIWKTAPDDKRHEPLAQLLSDYGSISAVAQAWPTLQEVESFLKTRTKYMLAILLELKDNVCTSSVAHVCQHA